MNDRDYLRSLGFFVGDRGRFSKEMKEALANRDATPSVDDVSLPHITQQRRSQILYGITKGGSRVAFITCSRCAHHMIWCECEKVMAPDNVAVLDGAAEELAELHPRMLELVAN